MICYIFEALSLRLGNDKLFIRFTRRDSTMWCCAKKNSCKLSIEKKMFENEMMWNGNLSRIKLYRVITYMRDTCRSFAIVSLITISSAAYILHLCSRWNIFKKKWASHKIVKLMCVNHCNTLNICISLREIYSNNDKKIAEELYMRLMKQCV